MPVFIQTYEQYKLKYDYPAREMTPDLDIVFEEMDTSLQEMLGYIKAFPDIANPDVMDASLLDIYLISKGLNLSRDFPGMILTEQQKRKLARLIVPIYNQKGTKPGIENLIRIVLSIEAEVISPYNIEKWKLGKSRLGVNTNLFVDTTVNKAPLYSFNIRVFEPVTEELEAQIRILAEYMKPIHTHLLKVLQDQEVSPYWRMGWSKLGVSTILDES